MLGASLGFDSHRNSKCFGVQAVDLGPPLKYPPHLNSPIKEMMAQPGPVPQFPRSSVQCLEKLFKEFTILGLWNFSPEWP